MFETSIFPHSAHAATNYTRRNGGVTVTCEGKIPYGSYARILLLWICTQAVITKTRVIKFPTITKLLNELGLSKHGKLVHAINEQIDLLRGCKITYHRAGQPAPITLYKVEPDGSIMLSGAFYSRLTHAPVPVDIHALTSIRKSTLAMDLLMFLSYRLPKIDTDNAVDIGLDLLGKQLGSNYSRMSNFRDDGLKKALVAVHEIYPAANVMLLNDRLRMTYSLPHVQKILTLEMQ